MPTENAHDDVVSTAEDRPAGEAIAYDGHPPKEFRLTEKQGRVAEAALRDADATLNEVASEADCSLQYAAMVLEHANYGDLCDMVLAKYGFQPEETRRWAAETGNWSEYDRLYKEVLPELLS